jgi:hypothetical protein
MTTPTVGEQAYANPVVSDLLLHAEALGRLDRRQSPVVLAGKDIRGKKEATETFCPLVDCDNSGRLR